MLPRIKTGFGDAYDAPALLLEPSDALGDFDQTLLAARLGEAFAEHSQSLLEALGQAPDDGLYSAFIRSPRW